MMKHREKEAPQSFRKFYRAKQFLDQERVKRSIGFNKCISNVLRPQQYSASQKSVSDIWNKPMHIFQNTEDETTSHLSERHKCLADTFVPPPVKVKLKGDEKNKTASSRCERPQEFSFELYKLNLETVERNRSKQFVSSPVALKVNNHQNDEDICHTQFTKCKTCVDLNTFSNVFY